MANVDLYLDTRRALDSGEFPLKLRVTHERKSKYYPTIYKFSDAEYKKIESGKRLTGEQPKIAENLNSLKQKANGIIKDLEFFSFEVFSLRLTGKGDRNDLIFRLQTEAEHLAAIDKVSSASITKQTYVALKTFSGKEVLPMAIINKDWLLNYEKWELKRGNSTTTIRMRMGRIKKMFNEAINTGEFESKKYPFAKGKYQIPGSNLSKRALGIEEISSIIDYNPDTERRQFAKDFFLFSYMASGMNMADVFSLKWENVNADRSFTFQRKKTKSKLKTPKLITIHLNAHLKYVIDKYGDRKINNDFVFNIINPRMTAGEQFYAIQEALRRINTNLKQIAKEIGLNISLTTYYARHSYATILMRTAPVAYIAQQLGHANISTTETYLGQFPSDLAAEYESELIPKKA